MEEVFNYLNKYQDHPPDDIKLKIKKVFELPSREAEELYTQWKATFMKPKVNLTRERKKND